MTLNAMLFLGLVLAAFAGFTVVALFLSISDALYERRPVQPHASGRKAAEGHGSIRHA